MVPKEVGIDTVTAMVISMATNMGMEAKIIITIERGNDCSPQKQTDFFTYNKGNEVFT